ncbi:MAG: SDR family oxidoreductase [Adhaeribacter sp.]
MSINRYFGLTGKTALVTGCNKGIGKGMALALAEAGADIIGVSASMPLSGSEVEQEVTALGRRFKAYACDLSSRDAILAFLKQVLAENPVIDILVNNAGTILRKPAADHDDELWDKVLAVNLDAPFLISREIGRRMVGQGAGKIIFTASLLTFQGGVHVPGYAASKGAIGSLVKALANEWAGKGVNVNAIAPGYIATDNTEALRQDADRSQAILSRIPAGRWGLPADFAGATIFLASPASDYVHGTILTVDGGWMGR